MLTKGTMKNKTIILLLVLFSIININAQSSVGTKYSVAKATASSTKNNKTSPAYTIDGNGAYDNDPYSRWSSHPTPQWLMYDLGKVKTVNKTRYSFYDFDKGRVYDYSIELSVDKQNWKTVVNHGSSQPKEYTINEFSSQDARYIKITLHSANSSKWATIWEGEVYGPPSDTTPPEITSVSVNSNDSIFVNYSEEITSESAISKSNYSLSSGKAINSIEMIDSKSVLLQTEAHTNGEYSLTANNISDLYGNLLSNSSQTYTVEHYTLEGLDSLKVSNVTAQSTENTDTSPLYTIDGKGAYDGDPNSRWSSYPVPQWIKYDLGSNKTVEQTRFSFYKFDEGRVYNYTIQLSTDNVNWITVVDSNYSDAKEFTIDAFEPQEARYIKLTLNSCNNTYWATVWEAEFYGKNDITPPTVTNIEAQSATNIFVSFTEALESNSATNVANYQISENISINSAELLNDTLVSLNTSEHTDGVYDITLQNISDKNGNSMSSGSYSYTVDFKQYLEFEKLVVENVIASSTENTDTSPLYTIDGKGAYDGDPNSRWSSNPIPQWIEYDLGTVREINYTRFSFYNFDDGRVYNYTVQISTDKSNWITVVENKDSDPIEYTNDSFDTQSARYVRLTLNSCNNTDWATVWEAEFYGKNDIIPPSVSNVTPQLATNVEISFSEPILSDSATNIANYQISNGITVNSVDVINDTLIALNTDEHSNGTYDITISGIYDINYNLMNNYTATYSMDYQQDLVFEKLVVDTVTASSTKNTDTSPMYTIDGKGAYDGDPYSRWSSYYIPQWIEYDLGSVKKIEKTRFSFYNFDKGRIYNYSIEVSEDKSSWTTVVSNKDSDPVEFTEDTFSAINARYVKLTLNSCAETYWATIWEGEIYGYNKTIADSSKDVKIEVTKGWNIVSVPVQTNDMSTPTIFNNENYSDAYDYQDYYVSQDSLKVGKGYWVRFNKDTVYSVKGDLVKEYVELQKGWNMVGYYDSVDVSQLYTEPANILSTPFYSFTNTYNIADSLVEGKGYWVKATEAGKLYTSTDKLNKNNSTNPEFRKDWGKILITDKLGKTSVLYISKDKYIDEKYTLPPVPPKNVFDIRFMNNLMVNDLNNMSDIKISHADYPLTIEVQDISLQIKDKLNGSYVDRKISSGEKFTITNKSIDRLSLAGDITTVTNYKLDQNFPNPFNPSTKISFAIPKQSKVSLTIYNSIGEEVETLINKNLEGGKHSVTFNAANLASGIYFYMLKTNNFTEVKKMTLLK